MKLADRVAIITGAAKGIGLGCAQVFARHGATVLLADLDREAGRSAARTMSDAGANALYVECDVTRESDITRTIDTAIDRFGRLDCLVNNAGWHPPATSIEQTTVADFEQLLRLNLTGAFVACKYAVQHLRRTRGNIINISSEVALLGQSASAAYVTTKAALLGLTRALALDLAPEGVRVNAVCPAGVMTPLVQQWAASEYDPAGAIEAVHRWHPMGRMATAEEIGEVCAFLASDEASFVTGQTICPDGGAALGYADKATPQPSAQIASE